MQSRTFHIEAVHHLKLVQLDSLIYLVHKLLIFININNFSTIHNCITLHTDFLHDSEFHHLHFLHESQFHPSTSSCLNIHRILSQTIPNLQFPAFSCRKIRSLKQRIGMICHRDCIQTFMTFHMHFHLLYFIKFFFTH